LNVSDALPGYRAVAARHQIETATRFEFRRQMVFISNIGFVRLAKAGADIVLSHVLVSEDARDSVTPAEATVHVIPLAASTKPPPVVEFR
jgi:hypothetical protein